MNRQSEQNPAICNLDPSYARRARLTTEVLLQGKWRIEILCVLRQGSVRLGQLARLVPAASKKMLTENLRKLEAYEIVIRNDLSDTTLHVEFDLNDSAREASPCSWTNLQNWRTPCIQILKCFSNANQRT